MRSSSSLIDSLIHRQRSYKPIALNHSVVLFFVRQSSLALLLLPSEKKTILYR
ncbi:hypothetical protein Hanom_Chr04g00364881 [Helianthus anomalus]